MTESINVVIYARTSTGDQSGGAETQIEVVTEAIAKVSEADGVRRNIVGVIIDENVYSDIPPEIRPKFPEVLRLIEEEGVKEVWAQSRDRFSRDVDYLGHIRVTLKKAGAVAVCLDDDEDKTVGRFKDVLGEMELDKYRKKRIAGQKRAMKAKKAMFRPPFGYLVNKETQKFEIDEELRPKIIAILTMLNENPDISPRRVAMLHEVPDSKVQRMRNNRIYRYGEVWYRGEVIYHVEPILPIKEETGTPEEKE